MRLSILTEICCVGQSGAYFISDFANKKRPYSPVPQEVGENCIVRSFITCTLLQV
jgi:hypothetical protein